MGYGPTSDKDLMHLEPGMRVQGSVKYEFFHMQLGTGVLLS